MTDPEKIALLAHQLNIAGAALATANRLLKELGSEGAEKPTRANALPPMAGRFDR